MKLKSTCICLIIHHHTLFVISKVKIQCLETSSRSRIEMGGPRCKIVSHDPMSGARGAKSLVWYIFSYTKGEKLGPRGPWIHYWETYLLYNTGKVEQKTFFLIWFLNINFSTMFSRKIFFTKIFNLPNAFLDIFSRQFFFFSFNFVSMHFQVVVNAKHFSVTLSFSLAPALHWCHNTM